MREVVYGLNDGGEAFRHDFTHLYHRIRRLEDSVAGYCLAEDAHAFIRVGFPRAGLPRFVAVSFDADAAEKFERRVEKLLCAGGYGKASAKMPSPTFAVGIEADFGEAREKFIYAFGGEEELTAFCTAVREASLRYFRCRFSGAGKGALPRGNTRDKTDRCKDI